MRAVGVVESVRAPMLVLELCALGSLRDLMHKERDLAVDTAEQVQP